MSGDILQTPDAPKPQGALDNYFKITARGSTVRQEVLAGLTTFLAMVYSVIVVPGMLGKAGFPPAAVFVATCLVAGFGSLLMGLWANLPMAIGCAISLTAFIPRQRLNSDHPKRTRTDAALTANTTGRIGLHHLLAHRQRPHGASANTRGVFTLMAHHRRTDAVQSLYLQPG